MWGQLAMLGGGLISSGMDAFRGSSKAEKSYEKYLKSKGITAGEKRKQLSNASGVLADKADMAKQNIVGNLQGQGLGNSIVGAQAGLKVDTEKNKSIVDRSNQIDDKAFAEEQKRKQMLMDYNLQRDQAKRQGQVDLLGGALSSGGAMLTDWMKKKNDKVTPKNTQSTSTRKATDHTH